MAPLLVHILFEPDPEDLAGLRDELDPGIEVTVGEDLPENPGFAVLVGGRPTRDQLLASPAFTHLVIPYAGLPASTRELLRDFPGLTVANLHHNAPATTEMALGLLLAAAKQILPMDRALRRGRWSGRGRENPAVLLADLTALIYGFGAIGRRVGRVLRALKMRVLAVRRRADRAETTEGIEVHPVRHLERLLPDAQVLMVTVPLTPETEGSIGCRQLRLLPRGAVLVNVARGPVVDEDALFEMLESGHLHSAGLDTWYRYPGRDGDREDTRPSRHPFEDLPNVVLSPHRGGWLPGIEARRMRELAATLNAIARGEEVPGRVDPEAGY